VSPTPPPPGPPLPPPPPGVQAKRPSRRRPSALHPWVEVLKIVGGGVLGITLALGFLKFVGKHPWFEGAQPSAAAPSARNTSPLTSTYTADGSDSAASLSSLRWRGRQPVPSSETQAKIQSEIKAIFDNRLSGDISAELKRKLATQLYDLADQTRHQLDERFVLLSTAAELATEAGDLSLMTSLTNILGAEYEYDAQEAQIALLIRFATQADTVAEIRRLVPYVKEAIADALAEDRYDAALALADATLVACQRPAGADLLPLAQFGRDRIAQMRDRWPAYQDARQVLESFPNDAAANLIAGRWLCLEKGQWKQGLAHLARAGDHPLADAARRDQAASLLPAADAVLARQLADRWYDLALRDDSDRGFLALAYDWYTHAQGAFSTEEEASIQTRMNAIAQDLEARRLLEMASR